jgi:DNA polymerase III epsilon subunit-like protein
MQKIYYDIETGPLPTAELEKLSDPFDPSEVKMGNIKDPDKRAAKLADAKANHIKNIVDTAALKPLKGKVLAIGLLDESGPICLTGPEEEILAQFWRTFSATSSLYIGYNIFKFDLPFLRKRSWKYDKVAVPQDVRRGRYWSDRFVDLREDWQMGDRQAEGSLDAICRHLGIEGKNGNGKDFARMLELNKEKALEYLENDLRMTKEVYERIHA